MPRVARIYTDEGVFHILPRGNNKQSVFHCDADFQTYKSILTKYKEEHPFKLYHYCLMTNHIHLILETNRLTGLSRFMKRVNLTYAYGANDELVDAGPLYEGMGKTSKERQERYRNLAIDKDLHINEKVFSRLFLGADDFIQKMEKAFDVKNARQERGRPKKEK